MNINPAILLFMNIVASACLPSRVSSSLNTSSCSSPQVQCNSSRLSSKFHCPSSSKCIGLDNGTSAICCPHGENCETVQPVSCNVQLQNPASYPCSTLKTSRLDADLPRCGQSCCPRGYTCRGDSVCIMDKASAFNAMSSPNSSTVTSRMISAASKSTLHSANKRSETTNTKPKCTSVPGGAVAAGFFPGAITGALVTYLSLFYLRKHPGKDFPPLLQKLSYYTHRSLKPSTRNISKPILADEPSYLRTDFLRRDQSLNADRTGTCTKNLPAPTPPTHGHLKNNSDDTLPLPQTPQPHPPPPSPATPLPYPTTPPECVVRWRQPSLELDSSIMVYPPGILAAAGLREDPNFVAVAATARRRGKEGTFTDWIQSVGFRDSVGEPCFRVSGTPPGSRRRRGEGGGTWA